jgi:hypothetical protein
MERRPHLRAATDSDFYTFYGVDPPATWFGISAHTDVMMIGLGVVYLGIDGRNWAGFARAPGVTLPVLMMKACRSILAYAAEQNIELHAFASPTVDGSVLLLRRLGFESTDETLKGHRIYRWKP